MIIEGVITTINSEGVVNVAPMGPIVEGDFESVVLRPWKGSTTYRNLCSCDAAVFHVVDEVDLIAEAVLKQNPIQPLMHKAEQIDGWVLEGCCQWFELQIVDRDLTLDRAEIRARVVSRGNGRPFRGFNRAQHAILEATILATRVQFLDPDDVWLQFNYFRFAVEKTGTDRHQQLFERLCEFVAEQYDRKAACDAS